MSYGMDKTCQLVPSCFLVSNELVNFGTICLTEFHGDEKSTSLGIFDSNSTLKLVLKKVTMRCTYEKILR